MAKVDLSDGRQCVALLHHDLRRGPNRGDRRQENLRASLDLVRVADRGVDGEQLLPARSLAQILLCNLPERVTRLYDHRVEFCRADRHNRNHRCRGCDRNRSSRLQRNNPSRRRTRERDARWRNKDSRPLEGRTLHRRLIRNKFWRSWIGNRRPQRHHRRSWRSERRSIREWKMELRRALKFLRLFLFPEMPRDVTKRSVGWKRLRVDSVSRFFPGQRSGLIFLRLYLSAIFGRENLRALQVLLRVDVLGFFLLTLLLSALLTSRFGDILSGALCRAKDGGGRYQNCRKAHAPQTGRTARCEREGGQGWSLEISPLHRKPTTGGHRYGYIYQNRDLMGTSIFCPGGAPLALSRVLARPVLRYDLPSGDCARLQQGGEKP
jgi:hypothetical protein